MANSDLSSSYNKKSTTPKSVRNEIINRILKRFLHAGLILLTIAFLSLLGLYLAQRGKSGLPITFADTVRDTFVSFINYVFFHPKTYLWHKEAVLPMRLVADLFSKSAGLLFVSLMMATVIGGGLGLVTALSKKRNAAPVLILASIIGVSTPSFLLAMLFWAINVALYNWLQLDTAIFPPTGFGWDVHLVLPALVLAARPIAQLMQVTNLAVAETLSQDYIRSAHAKGVSERLIVWEHIFPNIMIPILTTLGTSLRFSLASLPVVESFFLWPGLGLGILQAMQLDMPYLITDLIVALGLMFLLLNAFLDFIYPLLDPRLADARQIQQESGSSIRKKIKSLFARKKQKRISIPPKTTNSTIHKNADAQKEKAFTAKAEAPAYGQGKSVLTSFLGNPLLMISGLILLGLFLMAIFGERLAGGTMVEMNGVMKIEGIILGPPFAPSSVFPWGSDLVGRDILQLILAGARQTLTLALLATIARVLFGVLIGLISGWRQNSWIDKLMQAIIAVWAAFPNTVFAMILILGMGIQKGMSVFIIALCIIGWDEIAQMIRGQVIQQKPYLYIEAARATGARSRDILINHILPHLFPTILVLMVMEMGSVLMLLAELGYLNIFLGGGFKVEQISGAIYHFSDVPEWGALLSNIRYYWRSYPWMVWGPGLMFFISILSFNIFGEGLRRFLDETRLVLNRFINRYSLVLILALFAGGIWLFRSNTPYALYKGQALEFNAENTMADIETLTDTKYEGRESGTQGAEDAALYIAERMEEIGLFPAGEHDTYLQQLANPRFQLTEMPVLTLTSPDGEEIPLTYREDFVEFVGDAPSYGIAEGNIALLVTGEGDKPERITYSENANSDRILMLSREDYQSIIIRSPISGILIVDDDPAILEKKYVSPHNGDPNYTIMIITPQTADRYLQGSDLTWQSFQAQRSKMSTDDIRTQALASRASMLMNGESQFGEGKFINVIGYIPGSGALTGERMGEGMDAQVIVVSAYFDGLGNNLGSPYVAGANDNASGVAAMLEIARVLKEGSIPPYKTIMFVAWSGGERGGELSEDNILNAKTGFYRLNVESVIELSGVAAGSGNVISLNPGSSYRLVNVFEESAQTMNSAVTTRGRGPHFGWPLGMGFLNRNATTATVSWDGADEFAHTALDDVAIIDLVKMQKLGETTALVVTVISREEEY
ncbi:MAG: ABC transporter permease subunit [Anaerolineaceae bacterium]|nr:ABC transporter permease subunit [Anaerolineaceae bacterium]